MYRVQWRQQWLGTLNETVHIHATLCLMYSRILRKIHQHLKASIWVALVHISADFIACAWSICRIHRLFAFINAQNCRILHRHFGKFTSEICVYCTRILVAFFDNTSNKTVYEICRCYLNFTAQPILDSKVIRYACYAFICKHMQERQYYGFVVTHRLLTMVHARFDARKRTTAR